MSHRALFPLFLLLIATAALASDRLEVLEVRVDRPTLHNLGVQLLIAGDDDRDARVDVRWRAVGDSVWRDALPLLRVWPETVWIEVPAQFAGSVFDLRPATEYELELQAHDPDGGGGRHTVSATTRPIPPADPATPRHVAVSTEA